MKFIFASYLLAVNCVHSFVFKPHSLQQQPRLQPLLARKETQTLGLLTFDLDDTLYPIDLVEKEANEAFVKAMARYGFEGLQRDDIVESAKTIREEMNQHDPAQAAALTHVQVRELAIRREMELATTKRKLQACADDWATNVDSLSSLVVANAKK